MHRKVPELHAGVGEVRGVTDASVCRKGAKLTSSLRVILTSARNSELPGSAADSIAPPRKLVQTLQGTEHQLVLVFSSAPISALTVGPDALDVLLSMPAGQADNGRSTEEVQPRRQRLRKICSDPDCSEPNKGKRMTRTTIEKRDDWQFVLDADEDAWVWERTRADSTVERSARSFGSLHECAADASTRGYGGWKNNERRQITPGCDALLLVE
jgi:hypothetical protein